MNTEKNIVDMYYKYIEKELKCNILDELLGKKYVVGKQFGFGNFSRIKIEEGIEISKSNLNKVKLYFNNTVKGDNILEVGYCYRGSANIKSLPNQKEHIIKEGDIFIYKTLNDISYFKMCFSNCKIISIHINFNVLKNLINPSWKDKIIMEWNNNMINIFKEKILIIQKASYQSKKIAEQIDTIVTHNIMEYIKLKLKTIEFLNVFFQEKSIRKFARCSKQNQEEIVIKVQSIIIKNIGQALSVKAIADNVNISEYKLQQAFKNVTGYTVYEYIKKEKIEKAKCLLKNTDISILGIVNEIGYENPSKFSSLFKKYTNNTPLKYRKLNKVN